MPYTPAKPPLPESIEELRTRIPGWGVDLDPRDRPSVPRLQPDGGRIGITVAPSERQPETWPRERSIEHATLTPVFGTSCPPKGVSGVMRRYAYRRFSEARAAHWLLLLAADRVDALESHARSFLTLRPDNPLTETGVRSELTHHGISSRVGQKRTDLAHQIVDPIVVAGPWVAAGGVAYAGLRAARSAGRGSRYVTRRGGPSRASTPSA
jgi:hypothetical protein